MHYSHHYPSFDHPSNILQGETIIMLLIMQISPVFCYFLPPVAVQTFSQHSVLECLNPSPYSSLNVKDQQADSHFYVF